MKRISLQTARLARDKKVIIVAKKMYNDEGREVDAPRGHHAGEKPPLYCTWLDKLNDIFRKRYGVHTEIYANASGWGWIMTKTNGTVIEEIQDSKYFDSYDDALDAGLQRVLNRVKV